MASSIVIQQGKELSPTDLATINSERVRAFKSKWMINPLTSLKEAEAVWFLLKDDDQLLAFAKLSPLTIASGGNSYSVFLLSTVIASVPRKGFGRALMNKIHEFASEDGRTIIGFALPSELPFYQKTDFKIIAQEDNKFVYMDKEGKVMQNGIIPGDVFYRDGKDGLIKSILAQEDKTVLVPFTH